MRRFEDLIAWQRARELNREIHLLTQGRSFARRRWLEDQCNRAAASVMANIAEGFGRYQRREFHRFVVIALGSLTELESHLYTALDLDLIDGATHASLLERSLRVHQLLLALRSSLSK